MNRKNHKHKIIAENTPKTGRDKVYQCIRCGCIKWFPDLSSKPQYELSNKTYNKAPDCI